MSTESYKRLMRSTYTHLSKNDLPVALSKLLDDIMIMPHPDKEIAFVKWSSGTKPFQGLNLTLRSKNKKEIATHY